jgi:hypothetical protein
MYEKLKGLSKKSLTIFLILSFIFSIPVAVSEAANPTPSVPFSGTLEEWEDIQYNSAVSTNDLTYFKAIQKAGKLYLCVKGETIKDEAVFYIDTDNNGTTGEDYSTLWKNGSGVDIKIIGEEVYKYDGGAWTYLCEATTARTDTVLETSVDVSNLGIDGSTKLKVAFSMSGNNYLPEPSNDMLTVEGALSIDIAPIVQLDGDDSEWAGLLPIAQGQSSVKDLYAFRTGDKLYVMAHSTTFDSSINLYINTDNDSSTGYQNWGQFTNAGGDYLVQGSSIFSSNGAGWDWTEVSTSDAIRFISSEPDGDGYHTMELEINLSPMGEISETLRIALEVETQGYAPAIWSNMDYAAVPILASPINIVVDGADGDWSNLDAIAEGQLAVKDLYAYKTQEKLYVMAHSTTFDSSINLYINTDNDPLTGYQNWGQFTNAGGDYLVQGTSIFSSNGAGWDWTEVSTSDAIRVISTVPDEEGYYTMELEINLSPMGEISETLRIALEIETQGYAPAIWSNMDYATAASAPSVDTITVDGNDSEWGKIDTVVNSSNTHNELYVVMDYTRLFTLVKGNKLNTQNIYYIDSDNDSDTGYTDPNWTASGIDYKIDRGTLYRFTGTQENPQWEKTGMVYMNINDAYIEMYLNLDQIGLSSPAPLKIGYQGRNAIILPQSGSDMLMVDDVVTWEKSSNTYYPKEIYDVLNNPFIGWVPWARDTKFGIEREYEQPHSLVYVGMTWREIEPEKGVYDWDGLEEKYQFDFWAQRGKKFNLRIVLDNPTDDPTHMDIPDWLYDELDAEGDPGIWYETDEIGDGFSPNYNHPLLIEYHEKLIEEFAARYDNDPIIAYIQLGSLGHWGEWHNWPEDKTGPFPKLDVSEQYVQHYLDNFGNKLIGMRKPFPIASENNLGLFNDMFGEKGSTDQWLEWTRTGWNEIYLYINEGQDPVEVQEASAMPDFWKYSFSGGEFYNGNASLSLTDDRIMGSIRQVRESHTSWLGPCSPAIYDMGCDIQSNIDTLHKIMGYRYVIEAVSCANRIIPGSNLDITMIWNNKGVAPMYYDWPIELSLVDNQGAVVYKKELTGTDIRNILPGRTTIQSSISIPSDLNGNYKLCVAIIDPDSQQPGIDLAIEGKRPDGRYELGVINITKSSQSTPAPEASDDMELTVKDGTMTAKINKTALDNLIQQAVSGSHDSRKTVEIIIEKSDAVNNVELDIPTDSFRDVAETAQTGLVITTGIGSLTFDVDAILSIAAQADAENITVNIAKVDVTGLSQEIQEIVGERPVYNFTVMAGDSMIPEFGGGKVQASIPYSLKPGEDPESVVVYYIDDSGALNIVRGAYNPESGMVTFTTSHFSKFAVGYNAVSFIDVNPDDWFYKPVSFIAARSITAGTGGGKYSPDEYATRAQFIVMLFKAYGIEPAADGADNFQDCAGSYYTGYIAKAKELGVTSGVGNNRFAPNAGITKQEMYTMLYRALKVADELPQAKGKAVLSDYPDKDAVTSWAKEAVSLLLDSGIIESDDKLDPNGYATRAQVAEILHKLLAE